MKKVTFYTDEELWKKFSASVVEKEGSTRKISEQLQILMKSFLLNNFLEAIIKEFNIKIDSYISSDDVKKDRPSVNVSSADLVRKGRDSRWLH
ncbi:MAG: hypothetical protein ACTSRS_20395 [Candidatus Helarchaeota archaeon]